MVERSAGLVIATKGRFYVDDLDTDGVPVGNPLFWKSAGENSFYTKHLFEHGKGECATLYAFGKGVDERDNAWRKGETVRTYLIDLFNESRYRDGGDGASVYGDKAGMEYAAAASDGRNILIVYRNGAFFRPSGPLDDGDHGPREQKTPGEMRLLKYIPETKAGRLNIGNFHLGEKTVGGDFYYIENEPTLCGRDERGSGKDNWAGRACLFSLSGVPTACHRLGKGEESVIGWRKGYSNRQDLGTSGLKIDTSIFLDDFDLHQKGWLFGSGKLGIMPRILKNRS